MLFLTDVNHVSSGKANETRQINLPSATASLQVVIGLCKRKETAALKFKAAASYRRVDRTAVRRLFSFAVARQFAQYSFLDALGEEHCFKFIEVAWIFYLEYFSLSINKKNIVTKICCQIQIVNRKQHKISSIPVFQQHLL